MITAPEAFATAIVMREGDTDSPDREMGLFLTGCWSMRYSTVQTLNPTNPLGLSFSLKEQNNHGRN